MQKFGRLTVDEAVLLHVELGCFVTAEGERGHLCQVMCEEYAVHVPNPATSG